jgi:hypothetical protein
VEFNLPFYGAALEPLDSQGRILVKAKGSELKICIRSKAGLIMRI